MACVLKHALVVVCICVGDVAVSHDINRGLYRGSLLFYVDNIN